MPASTRQNTLFVSEDWIRIYEALQRIDFRAYDQENLVQALLQHLRINYPEQFNDWIASSEFVMKLEILGWLSQNLAFRTDLNSRENFLATAERRDSLIRLAQLIGYKVNRVRSASGLLKIQSISTNQGDILDANGKNLKNQVIAWNDIRNENWFEQFILVLNSAFAARTQFGSPIARSFQNAARTDQYVLNSLAPVGGAYRFSATVNNASLPFDIYNGALNEETKAIEEIAPNPDNAFSLFYMLDGNGNSSPGTGFFLPFKQGNIGYQDENFPEPQIVRTVALSATNVNNDDLFVQRIDEDGNVVENWEEIDALFGGGVSFDATRNQESPRNIYEADTLLNDQVRIRFGDGSFGNIPQGLFRIWYRTANPVPAVINPRSIQSQSLSIPYASGESPYALNITYSLAENVSNGSQTELNENIRERAGKVFYTQNRMISGQDYNNFFLRDSRIEKAKAVNRTYAGHSGYAKLSDPTGLYQNIKHIASDGRIYVDTEEVSVEYPARDILNENVFMDEYIAPLLRKQGKKNFFLGKILPTNLTGVSFQVSEYADGSTRGTIQSATGGETSLDIGGILNFVNGSHAVIKQKIDGDAGPEIVLNGNIEGGAVASVYPAYRNYFNENERASLRALLEDKISFSIEWGNGGWAFNSANPSRDGDNWVIYLEYDAASGESDAVWRITERGRNLYFESVDEVNFVFVNTANVIDSETGLPRNDSITLLKNNESFLSDIEFFPIGTMRHQDGFVSTKGVEIASLNRDDAVENPFAFDDIVDEGSVILWRKTERYGTETFEAINEGTSRKGRRGTSRPSVRDSDREGDVHLQLSFGNNQQPIPITEGTGENERTFTRGVWRVFKDGRWEIADKQDDFSWKRGREGLHFLWTHYSPETSRIDPSVSNVMNVYLLTSGYREAYQNWLERNGSPGEEPQPESSEQLRIQYSDFDNFKAISDSIVYYSARFKPLFGKQAVPELRSTFKIIQTPSSTLTKSDLKLRVLSAIHDYFNPDRWEFGEQFYFTELVAYVHSALAGDLQSMVIVPTQNDQAFGRLFQVRAEPDELFISAASPEDIQIVGNFTDSELRIGTL